MTDQITTTPPPSDIFADWLTKDAERERLHAALMPDNERVLFEALIAAGISCVEVHFEGYGDSGQIESVIAKAGDAVVDLPQRDVTIVRAHWGQPEPERATLSLAEGIEQIVYDLLEATYAGWENNEGAYGDFIFDVASQSITLDYNERYESSNYTQHVF